MATMGRWDRDEKKQEDGSFGFADYQASLVLSKTSQGNKAEI